MRAMTLMAGAAAGAAAAWFLDPNDGTRRRNMTRDKAMKMMRRGKDQAARKADYAAGQAKGAVTQTMPGGGRPDAGERLNDPALARKVESEIFRDADAPKGQVSVDVQESVVYLRGELDDPQWIDRLADAAGRVEGVRGVENRLHAPASR
jgi:osmotically-inducible protein OsmY